MSKFGTEKWSKSARTLAAAFAQVRTGSHSLPGWSASCSVLTMADIESSLILGVEHSPALLP